ncbi:MAG: hypothetical protein GF387_02000 [Candidatus Portnoybacteria bacterium]|nr:hypothetical protein [Candidatus Portnoybacteria bacterium]
MEVKTLKVEVGKAPCEESLDKEKIRGLLAELSEEIEDGDSTWIVFTGLSSECCTFSFLVICPAEREEVVRGKILDKFTCVLKEGVLDLKSVLKSRDELSKERKEIDRLLLRLEENFNELDKKIILGRLIHTLKILIVREVDVDTDAYDFRGDLKEDSLEYDSSIDGISIVFSINRILRDPEDKKKLKAK